MTKRAKSLGKRKAKAPRAKAPPANTSRVKTSRARTAKPASATRKPAGGDTLDTMIDASARALALLLDEAWKPAIKTNLDVTLRMAAAFADFPLPDDTEPAPVFSA